MIDFASMAQKLFEYAPAVLILLILNIRADRRQGQIIEWCLRRLERDDEEKD